MAWEIISTLLIFGGTGLFIYFVYSSYQKEHGEKIQSNISKIQELQIKKMEKEIEQGSEYNIRNKDYRPKFCTKCGNKLELNQKYCGKCGGII